MTAKETITLVGAGPVGSLLAVFLARRGFSVHVYERRPDMRLESISAGRSINLAVSTRGIHALEKVGLAEHVLSHAVPMRGRMMHSPAGDLTFQPYGKDDTQYINSLSRGGLNKDLMTAAEESGRVRIHFNKKAVSCDFAAGTLTVIDEHTHIVSEVETQILIGTDGSASAIRDAMVAELGHECSQSLLDYGYKELTIPPGPGGSFSMEKNALHIWPRGTYMLIALPNYEGSYTCTLFLPSHGEVSFDRLHDANSVEAFFAEHFADAKDRIETLSETFFENPTGHMVTVKCFPWNAGGRALLVGDAAHAIVPFFGQGMNCGFEDLTVLDACLDKHTRGEATDWEGAFSEFVALRKDNADAIADLAVENFVEMRDKVADPRFLLEKAVEKVLQREFPGDYVSRYALVTFSRVPYSLALEAGRVADEILAELCHGLQDPEAIDREKAARLIRAKFSPLMKREASLSGERE